MISVVSIASFSKANSKGFDPLKPGDVTTTYIGLTWVDGYDFAGIALPPGRFSRERQ